MLIAQIADRDRLLTMWAQTTQIDAHTRAMTVQTPLLAPQAGPAAGALIHGDPPPGHTRWNHNRWNTIIFVAASPPRRLTAGRRAVHLPADRSEDTRTDRTHHCRHNVVTQRGHHLTPDPVASSPAGPRPSTR